MVKSLLIVFIVTGLPIIVLTCNLAPAFAQDAPNVIAPLVLTRDTSQETDLIDIANSIFKTGSKRVKFKQTKKVYFSFLPSSSVPDGGGRALVTSTTAAIYFGPRKTTNISSATFAPYWNFKSRFGLPLRNSIWLRDNEWFISGDTRFLFYPQYTWGLGSNNVVFPTLVDNKYIRFYQNALKKITPFLFGGVGYNLDYHFNIHSSAVPDSTALGSFFKYPAGVNKNSLSSGVSISGVYDSRSNSINPLPGSYINAVIRINPSILGSNLNWQSLYLDYRKYVRFKSKVKLQHTLALWSYVWTVLGGNVPYLDLPAIGQDAYNRSGRGIDENRYRGKTLAYFEAEYRQEITRNGLLGFVVFSNVNSISGSGTFLRIWHPAAGTGIRIKFNKGSNVNVGIDYGFSQHYSSLAFNLGEAF